MKLTAFTDYSLRVLIYLAAQPGQRATIGGIAQAYQARNTAPAANTMSPGTRSHTSVSITSEWMISGERAYHRPLVTLK